MASLVRHLAERGEPVLATDQNPPDAALHGFWKGLAAEVTFRPLDVTDAGAVRALVDEARPERAVHGAAITAIPPDAERARFARTVEVNVMGTMILLEALRGRPGRVVVVSSGSVYGPRETVAPIGEDDATVPQDLYQLTKFAADALARRYAKINAIDLAVVRLASPFGPFERDTGSRPLLSPIHAWVRAALRGEPIRVSGPPGHLRDAIHVEDVASGIATVLLAPRLHHDVYNVGWGRATTARETLETLARLVPGLRYEFVPDETSPWATRGPLACDRLRALGWQPRHDLASGLAAYLDWLRSQA